MTDGLEDALEEVVELWRGMYESTPKKNGTTLLWCADELEALLEEHADD